MKIAVSTFLILLMGFFTVQGQNNFKAVIDSLLSSVPTNDTALSINIWADGQVLVDKHFGYANIEHKVENNRNTVFQGGFLSHQFTAFATLSLAKEGIVQLDAPLLEYLPEFSRIPKNLLVKHLGDHSSGLYDYWSLKTIAGWKIEDEFDRKYGLEFLKKQRHYDFQPGQKDYFNLSGYLLLAELIERKTAGTFQEYLSKKVFGPLGLHHTKFVSQSGELVPNMASYYSQTTKGWKTNIFNYHNDNGAVGLFTSASDVSVWLQYLIELYHQNSPHFAPLFQSTPHSNFTFGLTREKVNDWLVFFQNGFYGGYRSYTAILPEHKVSIAIFTNNANYNAKDLGDALISTIIGKSKVTSTKIQRKVLGHQKLNQYVGSYWDPEEYHSKRVYLENDSLQVYDEDYNYGYSIFPISNNEFNIEDRNPAIKIRFDTIGYTKLMSYIQNGEVLSKYKSYVKKTYPVLTLEKFAGRYYSDVLDTTYEVNLEDGQLTVNHPRADKILLRPLTDFRFATGAWYMSEVDFHLENDSVLGFYVNSPEIKKLYFKKFHR